jgi:hypothetical protein
MKELDTITLNKKSPYIIKKRTGCDYAFQTDYGVSCIVSFMEDYSIWEEGAYQFIIGNETQQKSPNDPKLRDTIECIIEAFFDANPDILLYVCETGDGKEAMRNRLFLRWLREYSQKDLFVVQHVEIEAEGIRNFAAIIIQKSNPHLDSIIQDFNSAIKELQKPL